MPPERQRVTHKLNNLPSHDIAVTSQQCSPATIISTIGVYPCRQANPFQSNTHELVGKQASFAGGDSYDQAPHKYYWRHKHLELLID